MRINSKEIELFKNISQTDFNDTFYDFHNDFDCIKLSLIKRLLTLLLQKRNTNQLIALSFTNTDVVNFEISNSSDLNNLTIDNLYRGRFEKNGVLNEFGEDGKSYFYLEFYEGIRIEFFGEDILIDEPVLSQNKDGTKK